MLQTIYNTALGKRYKGYLELKDNVLYIKRLVDYYSSKYTFTEFFRFANPDKNYNDNDIIPMQCIFLSIIILYGKCFTNAERRGVRLEEAVFKNASGEVKKNHKELMDVRNNFVAHAGHTQLEVFDLMVAYDNGFFTDKSVEKTLSGQLVEKENMMPLLDVVLAAIDKQLGKLQINVDAELNRLDLSAFFNKAMNKEPITEVDLKSL